MQAHIQYGGISVWDRNGVGWTEIGMEGSGWGKELRGRRMTEEGVERLHLLISQFSFFHFLCFLCRLYFISDQTSRPKTGGTASSVIFHKRITDAHSSHYLLFYFFKYVQNVHIFPFASNEQSPRL